MTDLQPLLTDLRTAVHNAREFLASYRARRGKRLQDTAIAGYIWSMVATAETIIPILETRRAEGAYALKRYLHESQLDVLFLLAHDDDDKFAARSLLSNFKDSRRLLDDHRRLKEEYPHLPIPELSQEIRDAFGISMEDHARQLDQENLEAGGSQDAFRRALEFTRTHRYWHWSGLRRPDLIADLLGSGHLSPADAVMALSLANIYNSYAPAAPAWAAASFPSPEGPLTFDDPAISADRDLAQLAIGAEQTLGNTLPRIQAFLAGSTGSAGAV